MSLYFNETDFSARPNRRERGNTVAPANREEDMSNPLGPYVGHFWPRQSRFDRMDLDDVEHRVLSHLANKKRIRDDLQFNHTYGSSPSLYPKPNGGHRILPSIYTTLRKVWLTAIGEEVMPDDMNPGRLDNITKLLKESHGNVVSKSTLLLGKMAFHFRNQPAIVAQLEQLCESMQKVEVDQMYPIFEPVSEAAVRKNNQRHAFVDADTTLGLWDDFSEH